jgi:hypothetical protein
MDHKFRITRKQIKTNYKAQFLINPKLKDEIKKSIKKEKNHVNLI